MTGGVEGGVDGEAITLFHNLKLNRAAKVINMNDGKKVTA
jgi:hypothetical protein